ncbi:Ig-like domain-containing protein [Clostridium beijerinckii]|uniref:Ig-like domain-containing protein n=1 Tax=Clostridium beijerinckii TaxID=1520 RepID=UPI00047CE424|nr:Ig-like domain-containing protein [Clostridium beijerinckii]
MISRKDIMYQHMIAFQGVDGKINDTDCRFLLAEEKDNNQNHYDLKSIITDQQIIQGDYVTIDGQLFMIIDTKRVNESTYIKGVFRKGLKITLQSNLKDVYAVVDKVTGVFSQGTEITEVHDEYSFLIPKSVTNMTSATTSNNAIIYAGGSYDAISIDDSKEGILNITGRFNSVYNPHTYTITLDSNTKTLVETETYTIVATATDNGIIVEKPTIIYKSSDKSVASVDSTGVVTTTDIGSATITCTYNNVSVDLTITVEAKPIEPVVSYTYAFSQSITALRQYVTTILTTTKTVSGVADPTLYIDYSFDSNAQSLINQGKIVVTRKSNSSISIKNASISTTTNIYLTVTDNANSTKILEAQQITLTGM